MTSLKETSYVITTSQVITTVFPVVNFEIRKTNSNAYRQVWKRLDSEFYTQLSSHA